MASKSAPSFKEKVLSFFSLGGTHGHGTRRASTNPDESSSRSSSTSRDRGGGHRCNHDKKKAELANKEQLEVKIRDIIMTDKSRKSVLNYCHQKTTLSFALEFNDSDYQKVERFDSGTYAEVFRGKRSKDGQVVIFKVIRAVPKVLPRKVREISFSGSESYDDILNEIIITSQLSGLHDYDRPNSAATFPRIHKIKVVHGSIPGHFLHEVIPKPSTPLRKEPFKDLPNAPLEYVVIEMNDGGIPLWKAIKESVVDARQLLSIAKQVTYALAVAEVAFEFEHRDLHISNVLVKKTKHDYNLFILNGDKYEVESCGFKVTLIDTTFSRYRTLTNAIRFKDMTETLRPRSGKEKSTLQDLIYTRMVEESGNEWEKFWPKTNVFWLYYLFKTILKSKIVKKQETNHIASALEQYLKIMTECKSAAEFANEIFETRFQVEE